MLIPNADGGLISIRRGHANQNQETVIHIAVPVETTRDVVNRLEEVGPGT